MGFDEEEVHLCGIKDGKLYVREGSGYVEKKSVTGLLSDVYTKDGDHGPELHIILWDKDTYRLRVFLNSGYASAFLCILTNISPAVKLTIKPEEKIDENGKKKQGLMLYQDGQALKWFYKKDTNGLPPPERDILTDRNGAQYEGWSFVKQTAFLLKAMDALRPMLSPNKVHQRNSNVANNSQPPPAPQTTSFTPPPSPDDLPF